MSAAILRDEVAEYRLLAAVLDQPQYILKLTDKLFTADRVNIYHAMYKAYMKYGEISYEGVERHLGSPIPQEVEVARGAKVAALLDVLVDLATKRQIAAIQQELLLHLHQPVVDHQKLHEILQLKPILTENDASLMPGINKFISDIKRKQSGDYKFISTGIRFLDHMLGGEWPRQGLAVIMAQSGAGKTALTCQSILSMALSGTPVSFLSLEMPKDKLILRFAANLASLDGNKIKKGIIEDEKKLSDAIEEIQKLPIYIIDGSQSINNIIYAVKQHKEAYGIEAFFVDYLQIISDLGDGGDDKAVQMLGYLTQQIRDVAMKEDIAAILLSQQNRGGKGLDSLLGSGRIGHIADTVLELTTEDSKNEEKRLCRLDVVKNREGPTGSNTIVYRPKYLRFE